MLTTYRRVFAHPGAALFSATGLVARLPISMTTLGIVLLVSALSGSYALAGQVTAAFIAGNAGFAVLHGRLTDRFGQTRVLSVDTVTFGLSSSLMVVAITEGWSFPWPHLLAVVAGVFVLTFAQAYLGDRQTLFVHVHGAMVLTVGAVWVLAWSLTRGPSTPLA